MDPEYSIFTSFLKNISETDSSITVEPPSLWSLMPKELSDYYTYNGTWTKPPCSTNVIWIDFRSPIYLPLTTVSYVPSPNWNRIQFNDLIFFNASYSWNSSMPSKCWMAFVQADHNRQHLLCSIMAKSIQYYTEEYQVLWSLMLGVPMKLNW